MPRKTKQMKKKNTQEEASICIYGSLCRELGYCKKAHDEEKLENEKSYRMQESIISNMVPLRATKETFVYMGDFTRKHLQIAFDVFHQQDYETAILNCKAVIQETVGCGVAYACIASAEYFLGNYDEANHFAIKGEGCYFGTERQKLKLFGLHCENLASDRMKSQSMLIGKRENAILKRVFNNCEQ